MSGIDRTTAKSERVANYVVFYADAGGYMMHFEVIECAGEVIEPYSAQLYVKYDGIGNDTENAVEADLLWHGTIKWDGCSNWDFHTTECMAHFCGMKDAVSIGALMARMYEIAARDLSKFDRECADMIDSALGK